MKYLRHILLLAVALTAMLPARAALPQEEVLNYTISYKWGFIHKEAATATLTLFNDGQHYRAQLSGETMSWIEDFMSVHDTLQGVLLYDRCLPIEYIKSTHQNSSNEYDVVHYTRNDGITTGRATRSHRNGDTGPWHTTDTVLHADGPTYDLLSIFYYLRTLDFKTMHPGQDMWVYLFSAYTAEHLRITFEGRQDVDMHGRHWPAYALRFDFMMDGQPCGHTMYIWYSTEGNNIPIKLKGVLSFGAIEAYYAG